MYISGTFECARSFWGFDHAVKQMNINKLAPQKSRYRYSTSATCPLSMNLTACRGSVQFSEHSGRFVERLPNWTTVRSERSMSGGKRQIGVFAIANKDGGTHRVFFIMQKYPILPRLWAIREELKYIRERLLNSDHSAHRPIAIANRKQNVGCTEQSPGQVVQHHKQSDKAHRPLVV